MTSRIFAASALYLSAGTLEVEVKRVVEPLREKTDLVLCLSAFTGDDYPFGAGDCYNERCSGGPGSYHDG